MPVLKLSGEDVGGGMTSDGEDWAALVPELLVVDLARSRGFYCDLCGFALRFAREEVWEEEHPGLPFSCAPPAKPGT